MRDLPCYVQPVIVQNAGQVNIAADGGHLVNVQTKRKKKAIKAGSLVTTEGRKLKPAR